MPNDADDKDMKDMFYWHQAVLDLAAVTYEQLKASGSYSDKSLIAALQIVIALIASEENKD